METIYGLKSGIEWNSDFSASRDEKGKWTGGESFTCKLTDATRLIPAIGAPCQHPGWSFMLLSSVKVANLEGGLASVECSYGGFQDGENPDEEEPSYTYELSISVGEDPIETHFRYKDVPAAELAIIQNLKAGKLTETDEDYIYKNGTDHEQGQIFEITSERGRELASKIQRGIESYLQPAQIWRASFVSKNLPPASILNAVGKITSAPGAPTVSDDRNWLFLGASVTETDKIFSISYEYQLSGPGGWDTELYQNS